MKSKVVYQHIDNVSNAKATSQIVVVKVVEKESATNVVKIILVVNAGKRKSQLYHAKIAKEATTTTIVHKLKRKEKQKIVMESESFQR